MRTHGARRDDLRSVQCSGCPRAPASHHHIQPIQARCFDPLYMGRSHWAQTQGTRTPCFIWALLLYLRDLGVGTPYIVARVAAAPARTVSWSTTTTNFSPPPLPSRQKDGQKATDPTDDLTLVDPIIYPFSFWKKKTTTF
jgi:hypothetical protein